MENPVVKTIVLNWNGGDDTLACLESLSNQSYQKNSIIVVDNGSTDDSAERIIKAHPYLQLIRTGRNLGFAGGNNVGISSAIADGAEAVLLLNNDTVAAPDLVEQMVRPLFADESIAAVNPKIYYYDQPDRIWSAGAGVDWRTGITFQFHVDEPDYGQCDVVTDIEYAVGCALMTRADVLRRVGPLDSDFFFYYEEAEWCQRARQAGYRILYVPDARLWHKVSSAVGPGSPKAVYYFTRNRLLFLKKTDGAYQAKARASLGLWKMAFSFLARGDGTRCRAVLKGMADSWIGRFGEAPI